MKPAVLIIAPYLPLPATFGGALRIHALVAGLAEHAEVSLLAPGGNGELPYAQQLGEICNVTLVPAQSTPRQPAGRRKRIDQLQSLARGRSFLESWYNPQMQAALDRILMTRRIDVVQYEFPESTLYRVPENMPTIYDAHNIEHDLLSRVAEASDGFLKQQFNRSEARKLRRLEQDIWARSTRCLATSERDAGMIRASCSTPVDVIPNGVDLNYFPQTPISQGTPGRIAFTGAMRHQPNADAVTWYVKEVHSLVQEQLPDATFAIVGADPPPAVAALSSRSILVTGQVPDVRPWLAEAQIVAVPLRSGGGTRLKILEAFAAGRPVVSTAIGAEGLDAVDGVHLLIADTPEAFAGAISRLAGDPALATELTTNARSLVEERYGWSTIVASLVHSLNSAIDGQ